MAEAVAIPVSGFNIPPMPGAPDVPAGVPPLPAAAAQVPGYVPPNSGQFSQADVERIVAAELAKAKPAPAPATPDPAAPASTPVEITGGGNDGVLDAYTSSFTAIGAGIDLERAVGKALTFGKPELIDTAYINEKGGAQAAQLVVIAKAIVERVNANAAQGTQEIYKLAGGTDNWNAASAAFNKEADPALKQVVITMLNSGDAAQRQSAAKMVVDYAANGGFVTKAPEMVQAGVAGGVPSQALDKAGFQDALQKLNKQSPQYANQRAQLFANRAAGKLRGL